ncbi:MAG: hypothetical protein ACRDU4_01175 [Mycobacterium sp.]
MRKPLTPYQQDVTDWAEKNLPEFTTLRAHVAKRRKQRWTWIQVAGEFSEMPYRAPKAQNFHQWYGSDMK